MKGWLPDKSETSYKLFFLLVKQEMAKLGLELSIESVISDYEISIIKAVTDILQVPIRGCFFHFTQCLKRKMEKSGMKTKVQTTEKLQLFMKKCGSLAHLPVCDVALGMLKLREFSFDDPSIEQFKEEMLKYIQDFWIQGPFNPSVWSCWDRNEDNTNNNQVCIEYNTAFLECGK